MSEQQSGNVISRGFSRIVASLNSVGGVLIFALVVMINLDIAMRFFFNAPIDGVAEMVELSIVAIVFLQLADAVRNGRLTRSDGLYAKIQKTRPRLGHALGAFFDIGGALFFMTLIAGSIPRLVDAWVNNYFTGNMGIVVIPIWPVRLIIVVGAITVVLVFISLAWKHIQAFFRHEDAS